MGAEGRIFPHFACNGPSYLKDLEDLAKLKTIKDAAIEALGAPEAILGEFGWYRLPVSSPYP